MSSCLNWDRCIYTTGCAWALFISSFTLQCTWHLSPSPAVQRCSAPCASPRGLSRALVLLMHYIPPRDTTVQEILHLLVYSMLLLLLLNHFKLVPLSNLQGHNNAILLDIKKVIELLNQCMLWPYNFVAHKN